MITNFYWLHPQF